MLRNRFASFPAGAGKRDRSQLGGGRCWRLFLIVPSDVDVLHCDVVRLDRIVRILPRICCRDRDPFLLRI